MSSSINWVGQALAITKQKFPEIADIETQAHHLADGSPDKRESRSVTLVLEGGKRAQLSLLATKILGKDRSSEELFQALVQKIELYFYKRKEAFSLPSGAMILGGNANATFGIENGYLLVNGKKIVVPVGENGYVPLDAQRFNAYTALTVSYEDGRLVLSEKGGKRYPIRISSPLQLGQGQLMPHPEDRNFASLPKMGEYYPLAVPKNTSKTTFARNLPPGQACHFPQTDGKRHQ